MRRLKDLLKQAVNTMTPHDFWKCFVVILSDPAFGNSGDFIL